jgi:Fe-Mn family superoxide dismutase
MNSHSMNRRDALSAVGLLGVAAIGARAAAQPAHQPPTTPQTVPIGTPRAGAPIASPLPTGWDSAKGEYVLPALPYDPAALEPHIDAQTMQIHHGRHHKAYVDGLNKATAALRDIRSSGDTSLIKHWSREVSFHASGHINHILFWHMMAPSDKGGGGKPAGALAQAIDRDFGSFDKFSAHFLGAAAQVEGGGWAWLMLDPMSRRLLIVQQEKQQDMMPTGAVPILGVDVWEHAYYLKYQNRRADYLSAFMKVVNWPFCQTLFQSASA